MWLREWGAGRGGAPSARARAAAAWPGARDALPGAGRGRRRPSRTALRCGWPCGARWAVPTRYPPQVRPCGMSEPATVSVMWRHAVGVPNAVGPGCAGERPATTPLLDSCCR